MVADLQEELALLRLTSKRKVKIYDIPTTGTLIGTLPRENSREIRFSNAIINNNPYLRIQVFQYDNRHNTWAPVKGTCSTVRLHELSAVKGFIQKAIDFALMKNNTEILDEVDNIEDTDDSNFPNVHRHDNSMRVQ